MLSGRTISRKIWRRFQDAIIQRHGSTYGNINKELENALNHWAEHLEKDEIHGERTPKAVIFGNGGIDGKT